MILSPPSHYTIKGLVLLFSFLLASQLHSQYLPTAGYQSGFFIKNEEETFSMSINGFAQPRFTAIAQEGASPFYNFDVGLARLAFSGKAFVPEFTYFLQAEATTFADNNTLTMLDWWVQYTFSPELYVRMGRIIAPYSRQFYAHPGEWLFCDLTNTEYAFHIQRVVGFEIGGAVGKSFSWQAIAMNSARPLDGGPTQQNIGSKLGAAVRLEGHILEPYGYIETRTKHVDEPELSIGVGGSFNPANSNSGFQNIGIGDESIGITGDIGFRTGPLSLQAAYHFRNTTRSNNTASIADQGYFAQAGFLVADNIELAARFSTVEFEGRLTGENFSPFKKQDEANIGFNFYLGGHGAKLQVDYSLLFSTSFDDIDLTTHRFRLQSQVLF